ncbi:hypothetical protein OPV22_014088 [Ensete ventricosum]|uniref:Uncharacterized protein n=1 Tax=Ensete ventricosum TaxID=4639 RepID=A0AAV8QX02_ENSVE|nr:hypothetical protein OPV22_014088 [Ensete ventricosum]
MAGGEVPGVKVQFWMRSGSYPRRGAGRGHRKHGQATFPEACSSVILRTGNASTIAVVFFVHHARTFLCIQSALPGRCCVLPWVSVLVGLWCRPETDGDGDQHGDRYRFVACNMLDRDETKAKLGPSTGGAALAFEATEETDVEPVEAPNHTGGGTLARKEEPTPCD